MPRKSAYGKLLDFFHTHRYGRLAEIGFWLAMGGALGLLGWWVWTTYHNQGLAFLIWLVAFCVAAFGLLPQKKAKAAAPKTGRRRAQIADLVEASKAEKKRKGPPPPGPPLRRG